MRRILFTLPLLAATAVLGQNQAPGSATVTTNPRAAQVETAPSSAKEAYARAAVMAMESIEIRGTCPVGMSARQQGGGQTVWTIALEDAGKTQSQFFGRPGERGRVPLDPAAIGAPGTGVHVDLKVWKGGPIQQVELAVHYLAPGWRVMPVRGTEGGGKPGDDLKKTYNLVASDGGSLRLAGDLLVGATAGITRVTLLRIEYADGRSWHAVNRDACSVTPNGFKLVGAR